MRGVLTYVLAAFGAGVAFALADAVQAAFAGVDMTLPADPKIIASAAAGWLIGVVGVTLAFLAVIGPLWLIVQLLLKAVVGPARGIGAVLLGVVLIVAVTVGATFAMWTFLDLGVDPSAFGGIERILLLEAAKASAPGLAWGLVFGLLGGRRPAEQAVRVPAMAAEQGA